MRIESFDMRWVMTSSPRSRVCKGRIPERDARVGALYLGTTRLARATPLVLPQRGMRPLTPRLRRKPEPDARFGDDQQSGKQRHAVYRSKQPPVDVVRPA